MNITNMKLMDIDFKLFDGEPGFDYNVNVTTSADLSPESKTYFSDYLIDLAEAELIHDQAAQTHDIPKNGGKTIEFRQFDPLPEMTVPLIEGVTPDGQSMSVRAMTSTVKQYGGFVTLSDMLADTSLDNMVMQSMKLIGSQAGRSMDTITKEVLNSGTVVQYSGGATSRAYLHYTSENSNCNISTKDIKKAVRFLEDQNAPKINGYYLGIIHPYVKYDIMNDDDWKKPHEYKDTQNLYRNEIGEFHGVRFVESSRAKKWHGENLAQDSRTLTVNGAVAVAATEITFNGGTVAAGALKGRKVIIGDYVVEVANNTAATLTLKEAITAADDAVIYPGEGGDEGVDVYSTLIIADDAYGTTKISGGGLQHIFKPFGSGGTADALNQRATSGWKATKTAEILIPQYIVRIESTATP